MVIEYLAAFTGLAGTFKSAAELTKAISDATDDIGIKAKTAELQTQILSAQNSALTAQTAQFGLLEDVRSLKAQIAQMGEWNTEKSRYKLCTVGTGSVVYALQESQSSGDPPHWLCPQCYTRGEKAFLQKGAPPEKGRPDHAFYVCMACDGAIKVQYNAKPRYAEQETTDAHPL